MLIIISYFVFVHKTKEGEKVGGDGIGILLVLLSLWLSLRVDEGDHNISRAVRDAEALMEMSQAPGMHQHPA